MECSVLAPRHFEDNFLLDFEDRRLAAATMLLRVRLAEGRAWLTYKGPPRPQGIYKVREELEVPVGDGSIAVQILLSLGMRVWFRYQKYRQEYALTVPGQTAAEVHLALDETPIGNYAELEGPEESIRLVAGAMGFDESRFSRASYYSLYAQYCRDRGESPGYMVFPGGQAGGDVPH